VREIAEIAHEHGAKFLVDGAQSVPHMKTDVKRDGIDFLAFSGHKMLGPTGVGVLYVGDEDLYSTEPLCIGGGTIADVNIDSYTLTVPPLRFEAGTPAIAQVIGLGEACKYLNRVGMENVIQWDHVLAEKMVEGLSEIEGVTIYGPTDPKKRVGLVTFNIRDLNPVDVALTLDSEYAIAVRSGHHCALPLMKELFKLNEGNVRASSYLYNTKGEVEKLLAAVEEIAKP
jgi:cysteine desulfurase/selenocysteine lyase